MADGEHLFEIGDNNNKMWASSLSTPWDITTATVQQSANTQDSLPQDIFFRPDGKMMFEVGQNDGPTFYQLSLSTAWDISTLALDKTVTPQDSKPEGIFFKLDGTKMYEVADNDDRIYQWELSIAWDLGSANVEKQFDLPRPTVPNPAAIYFKPDGTMMFIADAEIDEIHAYVLSTPWEVDSASLDDWIDSTGDGSVKAPQGLFFKNDGTEMYQVERNDQSIYQTTLSTPWDISTSSELTAILATQDDFPRTVVFETDFSTLSPPGKPQNASALVVT